MLVVAAIPLFICIQLRQGVAIVAAAKGLRGAEFSFMRTIEENLVFTVSRKVLGIGHALDKSIHAAQEGLVKKFEVLDRRDAASQRQLMTFNVLLRCAALVLGVFLMLVRTQGLSPHRTIALL